ncbi:hypothetical protein K435DRAFT_56101 [Dendrothele bispora CBS 962.96]|uniref:Uncharacterized protein n=1 Tax=Dendrothele bispora (strain CBS 962.96) TaxID=1314807 RepID=A0A4S8M5Y5_DENBC|nr:hypothetical protein K435DRAFT_56101 [Dendrothele bispora CBS 962.96]
MNARLQPTVRCLFDSEESILRIVMPEFPASSSSSPPVGSGSGSPTTSSSEHAENQASSASAESTSSSATANGGDATNGSGAGSPEIVVYAMKPGRFCSKQEFMDFATSVMKRPSLKTSKVQI